MAILRVHKTSNYTIMSNYHFKEKEMSLKAKGLLSLMLSLPDDWDYSIEGLVSICKENETAIVSTLKELKQFGYLVIRKLLPNETTSGRIEYEYDIYETPNQQKQESKKQDLENLGVENLGLENQGQEITNNKITNKLNTNNNIYNIIEEKEITKEKTKRFSKPTIEQIREYCRERGNNISPEYFYNYYESNGWCVGKNKMKDWKATIRNWEIRDKDNHPKKSEYSDIAQKIQQRAKPTINIDDYNDLNF